MTAPPRWEVTTTDANIPLMCAVLGVRPATATVMAHRGLRSKNAALGFLQPDVRQLALPFNAADTQEAFRRLAEGLSRNDRMFIYGDYDVDGVMSTAILYKALRHAGADVHYYIPHREEEGYGLNADAVRRLKALDTDLLITCDNGIAALEEIKLAQGLGMDVVVIDHHEPGFIDTPEGRLDVLPEAAAVVDPKRADCPYPFKEMCAAGLSFRFAWALYQHMGRDFAALWDELLVLAAIATVCDIVDLQGENRLLVKAGLATLNANPDINPGLGRLIALKGYQEKPIDTFTLGFVLGPCINATGRLENAEMAVRMLLSQDTAEQNELAQQLAALNDERKEITKKCVARALEAVAETPNEKVVVLVDTETHESIAGIVAGRVKEEIHRPVIMLTRGAPVEGHGPVLKGSGRAIPAYNLFEALYAQRELFIRFGGHAMAAGLSLEEENVDVLRERLNAGCTLSEADFSPTLLLDAELPPEDATLPLAQELERLAPFGKGNREPLFLVRGLRVAALRDIHEKNTLIFTFLVAGRKVKGIAFGLNVRFWDMLAQHYSEADIRHMRSGALAGVALALDVACVPETNTYNGNTTVQLRIKDVRI